MLKEKCAYKRELDIAKKVYYRGKIEDCKMDWRLYQVVNSLTTKNFRILPDGQSDTV